jgi:hypothetical protein
LADAQSVSASHYLGISKSEEGCFARDFSALYFSFRYPGHPRRRIGGTELAIEFHESAEGRRVAAHSAGGGVRACACDAIGTVVVRLFVSP